MRSRKPRKRNKFYSQTAKFVAGAKRDRGAHSNTVDVCELARGRLLSCSRRIESSVCRKPGLLLAYRAHGSVCYSNFRRGIRHGRRGESCRVTLPERKKSAAAGRN